METSQQRQFQLIQLRLQAPAAGPLAQFLRDHNFPTDGKFKSAFDAKYKVIKDLAPYQQAFIVAEGCKADGKDLTQKRHSGLIPTSPLASNGAVATNAVVRTIFTDSRLTARATADVPDTRVAPPPVPPFLAPATVSVEAPVGAPVAEPVVKRGKQPDMMDALAALPVKDRMRVIKLMEGASASDLMSVIAFVITMRQ
jgi:hypothetical protein